MGRTHLQDTASLHCLRPMPEDHPFFTGSNPAFSSLDRNLDGIPDFPDQDGDGIGDLLGADHISTPADGLIDSPLIRGPWDVDNDNDGVANSIWVDLGSPLRRLQMVASTNRCTRSCASTWTDD